VSPEVGSRTEWRWALRVLKRMKDDRLPRNLRVSTVGIKTAMGAGMHTAQRVGINTAKGAWAVVSKGELCNITASHSAGGTMTVDRRRKDGYQGSKL
jgi:hypothetical protein